jgi:hypothetical protein
MLFDDQLEVLHEVDMLLLLVLAFMPLVDLLFYS